ncbi:Smr/MutS family protein [Aureimonas jatrophae]|uniref:DNA-nicking endonuclease, Smr domain n=1 Tax=Aureimonas jatrophae TaxID=1166073 RepID=A0A1H0K5T4_9HYPH|nr:Smr/MutS family protein [Aureimonas jatrophae]MBB3950956.1 DNA-nicking Smr family endonuclease [Aureimonas jatrophae]SDO51143.1 DNA-nicking endonuclease, Smr domain [Aureimonas jatrophae]
MRKRRALTGEEKRLWRAIALTAKPMRGRALPEAEPEPDAPAAMTAPPPAPAPASPAALRALLAGTTASAPARGSASPPALHPIERPVRRKIGRGRIPLEDRIDLHGQTEASAHGTLLFFLRRAQANGLRIVLVITGRGASLGSTGSLKRALPHWFATADFRSLVSGFEPAERGHGGEGAFYVRVRKRPGTP